MSIRYRHHSNQRRQMVWGPGLQRPWWWKPVESLPHSSRLEPRGKPLSSIHSPSTKALNQRTPISSNSSPMSLFVSPKKRSIWLYYDPHRWWRQRETNVIKESMRQDTTILLHTVTSYTKSIILFILYHLCNYIFFKMHNHKICTTLLSCSLFLLTQAHLFSTVMVCSGKNTHPLHQGLSPRKDV